MRILTALFQCCAIRPNLLRRLLFLYSGPTLLSHALYISLQSDPISPVLSREHFPAVDRRLEIVLQTVKKCIENAGNAENVIMQTFLFIKGSRNPKKSLSQMKVH